MKSYSELCRLGTFEDRLGYLQLHGEVGKDTFGFDRYLNQDFYRSKEWRQFRDRIIVRDGGCDLGCKDHPIADIAVSGGKMSRARITIHHINPLTKEDILEHREALFDPENVISVSDATHKTIHYGTGDGPKMPDGKRTAGIPALGGNRMNWTTAWLSMKQGYKVKRRGLEECLLAYFRHRASDPPGKRRRGQLPQGQRYWHDAECDLLR